jgi:hypothetical protein
MAFKRVGTKCGTEMIGPGLFLKKVFDLIFKIDILNLKCITQHQFIKISTRIRNISNKIEMNF